MQSSAACEQFFWCSRAVFTTLIWQPELESAVTGNDMPFAWQRPTAEQAGNSILTCRCTNCLQEACSLAKRCLRRARQRGASRHSAARIAATVLTRAAVDRGSRDNVTVVVVDLSRCGSL